MAALTEQDRERLREMTEEEWVSANLARDWDAALALCTEDLVYMPPDHPVLQGRQEWVEWAEAFPEVTTMSQWIDDVSGDTLVAVVRAGFKGTLEADGQELSFEGKVLCSATKESDRWLYSAICFNLDGPPSPSV
jgi:ketosteroid isomerase-like protein